MASLDTILQRATPQTPTAKILMLPPSEEKRWPGGLHTRSKNAQIAALSTWTTFPDTFERGTHSGKIPSFSES